MKQLLIFLKSTDNQGLIFQLEEIIGQIKKDQLTHGYLSASSNNIIEVEILHDQYDCMADVIDAIKD